MVTHASFSSDSAWQWETCTIKLVFFEEWGTFSLHFISSPSKKAQYYVNIIYWWEGQRLFSTGYGVLIFLHCPTGRWFTNYSALSYKTWTCSLKFYSVNKVSTPSLLLPLFLLGTYWDVFPCWGCCSFYHDLDVFPDLDRSLRTMIPPTSFNYFNQCLWSLPRED